MKLTPVGIDIAKMVFQGHYVDGETGEIETPPSDSRLSREVRRGTVGTLVGGPAVGAVSAAVGGYVGSLAGTAGGLLEGGEGTKGAQHPRPAGMMLAVRIANSGDTQRIIERLRQHGAAMSKGLKARGKTVTG